MNWTAIVEAIRAFVWAHTPANDNWPIVDEIAINLCRKVA